MTLLRSGPEGADHYRVSAETVSELDLEPKQSELFAYWQSLAEAGSAPPDFARFDPLDIPSLLGDLSVVEVHRPGPRFRFRVYGTRVAATRGKDMTGRWLDEPGVFSAHLTDAYLMALREVSETGAVMLQRLPYQLPHLKPGNYDRLHLPFAPGPDDPVDRVVISFLVRPFV